MATGGTGSAISFSRSPYITSKKLDGQNYLSRTAAVEMWLLGQGHHDHLEKDESHELEEKAKQWKQADFQLCALLWQSVEPRLLMFLKAFKTCHSFWKRTQNIYYNDIQRLYDSTDKLASLKMTNHDMISFMNEAQSAMEDLQMFLEVHVSNEMKKLDKYYMVMIPRAIHPDFNYIRDQLLTSHEVPSMETLIQRMIHVPKVLTHETLESPARVESFVMAATRGRGERGPRGGRGGHGRPQCTYCKRMGHTQENCYTLQGFPSKTANVSQA